MESLDKSQIPPLHQKRIIAFVNHFLITSCDFLNNFATKCESKFIELERKMQKIEAALTIIEGKLDSIPHLAAKNNDITLIKSEEKKTEHITPEISNTDSELHSSDINEGEDSALDNSNNGVRVCDDPRYKKFFKMVQVGVPYEAVKIKMQAEGLDPNILDTPNILIS